MTKTQAVASDPAHNEVDCTPEVRDTLSQTSIAGGVD